MRIDAGLPVAPVGASGALPASSPATSFAELLGEGAGSPVLQPAVAAAPLPADAARGDAQRDRRAFQFDELGVFGAERWLGRRNAAQPEDANPAALGADAAEVALTMADQRPAQSGAAAAYEGKGALGASARAPASSSAPATSAVGPALPRGAAAVPSPPSLATTPQPMRGQPEVARAQRAPARPVEPPRPAAAARITLAAGEAGEVAIAARAAGLEAEAQGQLLRRAADVLAGYGLRLAALHLNGARLGAAPSTFGGGARGDRTG